MLFGTGEDDQGLIRADDQYGIMRSEMLRKVAPQGSFYHSDRVIMTEVALTGRSIRFRSGCTSGATTATGHSKQARRYEGGALTWTRAVPTGCCTRPCDCWPSSSGATSRRSGGRRFPPPIAGNATASSPGGSPATRHRLRTGRSAADSSAANLSPFRHRPLKYRWKRSWRAEKGIRRDQGRVPWNPGSRRTSGMTRSSNQFSNTYGTRIRRSRWKRCAAAQTACAASTESMLFR